MNQPASTPHMEPTLGLRSVVFFGLAYMGPLIGIGIFGVIATKSQGAAAGAMVLATVAILFTAISYGTMARRHPASGSAYTYARKTIGPRVGFMVGWSILLDYLFIPLVIWLVGAEYLSAQFPGVPKAVWVIAFVALTTLINYFGIKVADRANFLFVLFEVLVLGFYLVFSMAHIWGGGGAGAMFTLQPFIGVVEQLGPIAAGAAVAAYLFLGFDAVSTLSEETKNAERNIPRGIVLIALIGGAIFIFTLYLLSIIEPGSELSDSIGSDIAKTIGGNLFAAIFLAALVCQQFTAGIAAQASSARLMYAMGRDGVFPRRFFAKLSERYLTPINGILVCGVIGLGAIWLTLTVSTSFINFGAFLGFTMVNVSVLAYFLRNRAHEKLNPLIYVVCPMIGAAVDIFLLLSLDSTAKVLGGIWVGLGLVYLLVLTRGFRRPPPELHTDAVVSSDPEPASDAAAIPRTR
ncbi:MULTISPECIES: APC family permease [unclassified Mycolicibacterium]|uniref:APC family permease n=1 Tax=unclassified Mycolicibacterium TaxID=2636767 RepID=UPI001F4BDC1B|nr:APC family permease [Mycolicibacterium sp. YH-1]UNB54604.1 APC family permease [Mycolicibacterium sp. YH-1]